MVSFSSAVGTYRTIRSLKSSTSIPTSRHRELLVNRKWFYTGVSLDSHILSQWFVLIVIILCETSSKYFLIMLVLWKVLNIPRRTTHLWYKLLLVIPHLVITLQDGNHLCTCMLIEKIFLNGKFQANLKIFL